MYLSPRTGISVLNCSFERLGSMILSKDGMRKERERKETWLEKALSKSVTPNSTAESGLREMMNSYPCCYFSYAVLAHNLSASTRVAHILLIRGQKSSASGTAPYFQDSSRLSSPFFHHRQILPLDILGSSVSSPSFLTSASAFFL